MTEFELVPDPSDRDDPADDDVGGDNFDGVADGIVRILQQSALMAVDATGALILERLFGGDADRFRARGPKETSLPKLADALAKRGMNVSAQKR